eukprot:TRINITY_DN32807_c0_g1_i1.p1 TRINITY_DN32807_c0_g1~~TRINITY_DN32807_c0_g1_i1.p1  ORF type:complete len:1198 (+),score=196.36 TRINITY_DN32807_c0_g1_i1:129-3722(+)
MLPSRPLLAAAYLLTVCFSRGALAIRAVYTESDEDPELVEAAQALSPVPGRRTKLHLGRINGSENDLDAPVASSPLGYASETQVKSSKVLLHVEKHAGEASPVDHAKASNISSLDNGSRASAGEAPVVPPTMVAAWTVREKGVFFSIYCCVWAALCLWAHYHQKATDARNDAVARASTPSAAHSDGKRREQNVGPSASWPDGESVYQWVQRWFEQTPSACAVVHAEHPRKELTYAELRAEVEDLAGKLVSVGVQPGEVVVVACPKSVAYLESVLAALNLGAAFATVDATAMLAWKRLVLLESNARAILADPQDDCFGQLAARHVVPLLQMAPPGVSSGVVVTLPPTWQAAGDTGSSAESASRQHHDDCSALVFSAASSGAAKRSMYSRRHLAHRVWCVKEACNVDQSSIGLFHGPSASAEAHFEVLPMLAAGGKLVIGDIATSPGSAAAAASLLHQEAVSHLVSSAPFLEALIDVASTREDSSFLGSLRHVVAVGGHLASASANRLLTLVDGNVVLHNFYTGSWGCGARYCVPSGGIDMKLFPAAVPVGLPQPHWEIYVMREVEDDSGSKAWRRAPTGEVGEVCIRSDLASGSKLHRERATSGSNDGDDSDVIVAASLGRLQRTGDMGRWRLGVVEVLGSRRRQMVSDALHVHPEMVESALKGFVAAAETAAGASETRADRALQDVAVVRAGKSRELTAFICERAGVDHLTWANSDLKRFCSVRLGKACVPKTIVRMGSLPKLADGSTDLAQLGLLATKYSEEEEESDKKAVRGGVAEVACAIWTLGIVLEDFADATSVGHHVGSPGLAALLGALGRDQGFLALLSLLAYRDAVSMAASGVWHASQHDGLLLLLYFAMAWPLPQLLSPMLPSLFPLLHGLLGVPGNRRPLLAVILARRLLPVFESSRLPKPMICYVLVMSSLIVKCLWSSSLNDTLDICQEAPGGASALHLLLFMLFGGKDGRCLVVEPCMVWFIAAYICGFYYVGIAVDISAAQRSRGVRCAAVCLASSMCLGAFLQLVSTPAWSAERPERTTTPETVLEGYLPAILVGLAGDILALAAKLLQPCLFLWSLHKWPVSAPKQLYWFSSPGCYVLHYHVQAAVGQLNSTLWRWYSPDSTGTLACLAILLADAGVAYACGCTARMAEISIKRAWGWIYTSQQHMVSRLHLQPEKSTEDVNAESVDTCSEMTALLGKSGS